MKKIILASSSLYRARLLNRLNIDFEIVRPSFKEDSLKNSQFNPFELAQKLAYEKGKSVSTLHPNQIVLSADQICHIDGSILHKPETSNKALEQLKTLQGKEHTLISAYSIFSLDQVIESYSVVNLKMKKLSEDEILHYIEKDRPYDCAGSYKFEEHGISLLESIECQDESAITGLPLIQLSTHLAQLGVKSWNH